MKTKKNAKKNRKTFNNSVYTPGCNVFGDKAETHLIVIKRETAFQQMMDCLCQLEGEDNIEFTFDMRCFVGHEEELQQVMAKVERFMALKAQMGNRSFYRGDLNDIA